MSIGMKNTSGYYDFTAYAALTNVARAEKAAKPVKISTWAAAQTAVARPQVVYIASPYSGDVVGNVERAKVYCRYALSKGVIPFAPHLLYPQFLDDADAKQRETGMSCGLAILARCDELWAFGGTFSKGMEAEITAAIRQRTRVRYIGDWEIRRFLCGR